MNSIEIPLEFDIACVIYHVEPVEVLQSFIRHVSFITSLSSGHSPGFREVANTIGEFSKSQYKNHIPNSFTDHREIGIQCMKEITGLIMRKGITESKKRKRAEKIVKCLRSIMKDQCPINRIYLSEEKVLSITDDFLIICRLHHISPGNYLNYFMSKISLADMNARASLRIAEDNSAMTFFDQLPFLEPTLGKRQHQLPIEYINMIDDIHELHAEVFFIRDLDRCREVYRQFFLTYYHKLKT